MPWPGPAEAVTEILRCIACQGRWNAGSAVLPLCPLNHGLQKIPLVGRLISSSLRMPIPRSYDADPQRPVLDTFDWSSSYYSRSKRRYEEVLRCFESCGLPDLHVVKVPISVRATMPATRRILNPEPEQAVERCAG